jgi:hypothetical protein
MTDDELRQIVRAAVARHLVQEPQRPVSVPAPTRATWRQHASHLRFVLPAGSDTGGACLIEPSVGCTHCGYCQSWGH